MRCVATEPNAKYNHPGMYFAIGGVDEAKYQAFLDSTVGVHPVLFRQPGQEEPLRLKERPTMVVRFEDEKQY